jgi:hypothetical protein
MIEAPDLFGPFVMSLLAAGGVYGAVKANLASVTKRQEETDKRLERHIEDHAKGVLK